MPTHAEIKLRDAAISKAVAGGTSIDDVCARFKVSVDVAQHACQRFGVKYERRPTACRKSTNLQLAREPAIVRTIALLLKGMTDKEVTASSRVGPRFVKWVRSMCRKYGVPLPGLSHAR